MSWYAIEEIDAALEETKELLLPFDLGTWARLLLIVLLTGNMGSPNFPSSFPSDTGSSYEKADFSPGDDIQTHSVDSAVANPVTGLATGGSTAAVGGALVLVLGIILMFFYLSSVFEFIFYQSLLDRDVSIRDNFREHSGKGFSYFGFRFTVLLAMMIALVGSVVLAVSNPAAYALVAVVLFLLIPVAIFLGLTKSFVLPSMIENDTGVVEGWRNFYPHLKQEKEQVAVYILVRFAIKIAAGIITLLWALTALLMLLIPFSILAVAAIMVSSALMWVVVGVGLIIWILAVLVVQIPIQTYLYYYAILVYHELTS